MVNWHPLGTIWHPLEGAGIYIYYIYIYNILSPCKASFPKFQNCVSQSLILVTKVFSLLGLKKPSHFDATKTHRNTPFRLAFEQREDVHRPSDIKWFPRTSRRIAMDRWMDSHHFWSWRVWGWSTHEGMSRKVMDQWLMNGSMGWL